MPEADAVAWLLLVWQEHPSLCSTTLFLRLVNRPMDRKFKDDVARIFLDSLIANPQRIKMVEWLDLACTQAPYFDQPQSEHLAHIILSTPNPSTFSALESAIKSPQVSQSIFGKIVSKQWPQFKKMMLEHVAVGGLSLASSDEGGKLSLVKKGSEGQLTLSDD